LETTYGIDKQQAMAGITERAARPLIREKDPEVKERSVLEVANRLNREQDRKKRGFKVKRVQVGDIKKIISKVKYENPQESKPLPSGKFNVIYADPPWKYEFNSSGGQVPDLETDHYATLNLEEIIALKIPADKDAVLFLWTTAPKLQEGLAVLNAWGFTYRTGAVWDKEVSGPGYYFKTQHEHLLVGKKGDMPAPLGPSRVPSVIRQHRGKHSEKPAVVYEIIEGMYPNGTRLELFARKERDGWTSWGNEI
jgi:N6-adenosine-specific RNA methylase IME4